MKIKHFFFFAGDKMTQFIKSHTIAITKVKHYET